MLFHNHFAVATYWSTTGFPIHSRIVSILALQTDFFKLTSLSTLALKLSRDYLMVSEKMLASNA